MNSAYSCLVVIYPSLLILKFLLQTELIRLISCSKPLLAATKVSEKIIMIINAILLDPTAQV